MQAMHVWLVQTTNDVELGSNHLAEQAAHKDTTTSFPRASQPTYTLRFLSPVQDGCQDDIGDWSSELRSDYDSRPRS